jgi:hypothetical protein
VNLPFRAGDLVNTVQLYDVSADTQDDYGDVTDTSALIGSVRAKIENLRGRQLAGAQQQIIVISHRVTMPWLGSAIPATADNPNRLILPRMYLLLEDGTRLDVIEADNVLKANRYWVLSCNEKVVS